MMLPAADIFSPQAAGAADSAAPIAPSSNSVATGVSAKKNSSFAETMEQLLAGLPQPAPSASSLPVEVVNVAPTAAADPSIVHLKLPSPAQPAEPPALDATQLPPTPPDFANAPRPTTPPDGAAAVASESVTPAVSEAREAFAPQSATPGGSPHLPKVKAAPVGADNTQPPVRTIPTTAVAQEGPAARALTKDDAGQSDTLARFEFSVHKDRRARAVESPDQAAHTLPASSVEHGSSSPSVSANHSGPVQPALGITDQIKDAMLTHLGDLGGDLGEQGGPSRTVIHLRLNPPELGQVHVHLATFDDQVVGRLVVQDDAVRAALESQMPELRQRLEEAGIALGRFDVAHDPRGQADARHDRPLPFHGFTGAWRPPGATPPAQAAATRRGLIDMLA